MIAPARWSGSPFITGDRVASARQGRRQDCRAPSAGTAESRQPAWPRRQWVRLRIVVKKSYPANAMVSAITSISRKMRSGFRTSGTSWWPPAMALSCSSGEFTSHEDTATSPPGRGARCEPLARRFTKDPGDTGSRQAILHHASPTTPQRRPSEPQSLQGDPG